MKSVKKPIRILFLAALLALSLSGLAYADDIALDKTCSYALSADALTQDTQTLRGVYVVSAPSGAAAELRLAGRTLRAGDVIAADSLDDMLLAPTGLMEGECALVYRAITTQGLAPAQTLRFQILSGRNQPPVCEDSTFETYKNIANTGMLKASDEENQPLSYQLVKAPKRGSVELHDDGSFTYTPKENKVGKDSFVYTATDPAGNVSNEACVKIKILKPADGAQYTDTMAGRESFLAVFLRENGAYTGREIAGNACFEPEQTVTRGDFLLMAMKLLKRAPADAALETGFSDEAQTPSYQRPYIVSAFRSGVIQGEQTQDAALVFRATDKLTWADAAVMLQRLLGIAEADSQEVFAADDTAMPAWAQSAAAALQEAGLPLSCADASAEVTRAQAAELLYRACGLAAERGYAQ